MHRHAFRRPLPSIMDSLVFADVHAYLMTQDSEWSMSTGANPGGKHFLKANWFFYLKLRDRVGFCGQMEADQKGP